MEQNLTFYQKSFKESYLSYLLLNKVIFNNNLIISNDNTTLIIDDYYIKNNRKFQSFNFEKKLQNDDGKILLLFNKKSSKLKKKNKGEYEYLNLFYFEDQLENLFLNNIENNLGITKINKEKYEFFIEKKYSYFKNDYYYENRKGNLSFQMNRYINEDSNNKKLTSKIYQDNNLKNFLDLFLNYYNIIG